jgi:transcriptional repressor NrdR
MRCPFCSHVDTRVVDSRVSEGEVRRRRECEKCVKRFTTYETAAVELIILKKDGRKEHFSREKVLKGLAKACQKLPVSDEELERVAAKVERKLYRSRKAEIQSMLVGKAVMKELLKVDHVAYLRFASVCKGFDDPKLFEEEIAFLRN